jgi:putative transcriptional regulator
VADPARYDALMLDYAAGALRPAQALLVETHLGLRPAARSAMAALEECGGALLEAETPARMTGGPITAIGPAPAAIPVDPRLMDARGRVQLAMRGGRGLAWRRAFFGFEEHKLPLSGATLLMIPAGKSMPRHGHDSEELTLVLSGAIEDEDGVCQAGDIVFADESTVHTPRVHGSQDCVCLVASDGGLQFTTWWGRAAARLLG